MTYQEVLNYLYAQLPMFHRIGPAAYKADLKNIQALCTALNHPEKKLKFIHIAGTNGKGSVSNMLAAVFQKNGYRTGLFTSPHLIDFRERIRLNGKKISKQYITKFVHTYIPLFNDIKPSFFEWTTILAFQYFLDKKADIVILETGMGGRLDSTNVVVPELSIITNIGEDHKQFLGNTLPQIAQEKAGIIKPMVPVLISEYQKEVKGVFEKIANEKNAPLLYARNLIKINHYRHHLQYLELYYQKNITNIKKFLELTKKNNKLYIKNNLDISNKKIYNKLKNNLDKSKNKMYCLKSSLHSSYQIHNIRCVLAACELMKLQGWDLQPPRIHQAIQHTPAITGFRGRWEVIKTAPFLIADIAHNKPGLQHTLKNLQNYPYKTLHIVFGLANDKEIDDIINLLPQKAIYYITQASVPRAMPAEQLFEKFKTRFTAHLFHTVQEAIQNALHHAQKQDLILITGSAFVVADALSSLK